MEYHIMVFQALCKHFAVPAIWRRSSCCSKLKFDSEFQVDV